ncbi:Olfactory receptor 7A17, partial [Camelus dromedarius]
MPPFSSRLNNMESENQTGVSEFLFLGLSGNMLIILATISDSHLHNPVYLFLFNLSLMDISTIVPKMLVNIQTENKAITYSRLPHLDLKIPHFCELAKILKRAYSDTFINDVLVYLVTSLL